MAGATIHKLSKGLDSGDILYHAFPKPQRITPFLLEMESVKVAIDSLVERVYSGEIFKMNAVKQDKSLEISYTRNADFTDKVAEDYLEHLLSEEEVYKCLLNRDLSLFKDAYIG